MRTDPRIILLWATLFQVILATKISIGFELLSQYYAYKMEVKVLGAENTKIAPGCGGSGPGGMCTFMEFVKHVSNTSPRRLPRIAWADTINDAGGPNTVDPDVRTVGRNFPTYTQIPFDYSFKYINDKNLHKGINTDSTQPRFGLRLQNFYTSVRNVVRGGGAVRPPLALIETSDPDFTRCVDSARHAKEIRRLDHSHRLGQTLTLSSKWMDAKNKGQRISVKTKRQTDITGKPYNEVDMGKTMRSSRAFTPEDQNAFNDMLTTLLSGKVPPGSKLDLDQATATQGHANAVEAINKFTRGLERC